MTTAIYVYHWYAWSGYLAEALWPDAQVQAARPDDVPSLIVGHLNPDVTHFLFHCDLTWTSALPKNRNGLLELLAARGITVLNSHVVDVSKRKLHAVVASVGANRVQADPRGDPGELLFLKTNLNCGGSPERRLPADERTALVSTVGLKPRPWFPYTVYRRSDLPPECWTAEDAVVERLIHNTAGRFYRAYVCGDRTIVSESASTALIKSMGKGLPRANTFYVGRDPVERPDHGDAPAIDRVAAQVFLVCGGFELSFGAIDILEDDSGVPYVCDVNSTPFWGESEPAMTHFLQEGLRG